jgi:hypothetical protein
MGGRTLPISVSVSLTVEMLPIYFAFFGFSAISTRRRSDSMTPFGLFLPVLR